VKKQAENHRTGRVGEAKLEIGDSINKRERQNRQKRVREEDNTGATHTSTEEREAREWTGRARESERKGRIGQERIKCGGGGVWRNADKTNNGG
jgi:hypothetical protein